MDHVENGMPVSGLPDLVWFKSARSGPQGNCVEFARLPGGMTVAVRNSRYPHGPVLIYDTTEIRHLIDALKAGDFDDLVQGDAVDAGGR